MNDTKPDVASLPAKWRADAAAGDQSSTAEQQDVGYQLGLMNCADELEQALAGGER